MDATPRTPSLRGRALLRRRPPNGEARRPVCHRCRRTPLVGERVHFYSREGGERLVCDLCRPRQAGAPDRTELMHAPDSSRAVRVLGVAA